VTDGSGDLSRSTDVVGVSDAVREQLLDGLPARVQGMADGLLAEWTNAVDAVPALARLATDDVLFLMRLAPREREAELRRRWGAELDQSATELRGSPAPRLSPKGSPA
jgi:hypothetical protein